jgi:nitrite reductase (NADH) large subunit
MTGTATSTATSTDRGNGSDTTGGGIVIVGLGMVGHRTAEEILTRDPAARVTVVSGEHCPAYDRVALSSYVGNWNRGLLEFDALPATVDHIHGTATAVDTGTRTLTVADAAGGTTELPYAHLVLATGSHAFVPPVPGHDLAHCTVYRTLDDLDGIRETVESARARHMTGSGSDGTDAPVRAAIIGGGLLGLEAANALRLLGAEAHIIERSPRLMPIQVDASGGALLADKIRELGVHVHTSATTDAITVNADDPDQLDLALSVEAGDTGGADADSHVTLTVDIVVFSTGVRPNDQLAGPAGLATAPRGGILVDRDCRTSDPHISAVGECAAVDGVCYGLVAPGYTTASIVADRLTGRTHTPFEDPDMSTRLKLLGVGVASFGDAHAATPDARALTITDPVTGVYKKLVMASDNSTLLGGVLVGDVEAYSLLRPMVGAALPGDPVSFIAPTGAGAPEVGVSALPDAAQICSCNAVTKGELCGAIHDGAHSVGDLKTCTKAGTSCGSCVNLLKKLLDAEGIEQSKAVCGHFGQSRAELFEIASSTGIRDFTTFIRRFGTGHGCEVCKPTLASIFATLDSGDHVLDDGRAALQDSNDRFLANIQRNGSYSVVPRMPAGQVTAEQLIVVGEIARDFDLYVKVTGAQRIDMFGARVEQLPEIWRRLVDAGMESGQAYGKSLRAVKSCVGTDWCRYGQQDSVKMAVELELRYRGLRSPHKLKMGVSGCARECAEARSKDVGVIATEHGWNLYVGGNGGATPRHAELLAGDLDDTTLIAYIDRFLGFYVRTADRLQRTAHWIEETEGGLDHIRDVVCEDSLGIAGDLEAFVATHVDHYTDEWTRVLEDPEKLSRFVSFVNAPESPDPTIRFRQQDGRKVPLPAPAMPAAV